MVVEKVLIYFVGTAGSGKTSLTSAFQDWCEENEIDAVAVNLDPGAESLPYYPEFDIREVIKIRDVMEEYGLGPNGAQIVAADLVAFHVDEIKEIIDDVACDYVLIDTPGQIELFAYRPSGPAIVEGLFPKWSFMCFVMDPFLSPTPSGFVSQLLLAASVQTRFDVPMNFLLNKMDLLEDEKRERILRYVEDLEELYNSLMEERPSLYQQLGIEFFKVLERLQLSMPVVPTSAVTKEGFEMLYYNIQSTFFGGTDVIDGRRNYDL